MTADPEQRVDWLAERFNEADYAVSGDIEDRVSEVRLLLDAVVVAEVAWLSSPTDKAARDHANEVRQEYAAKRSGLTLATNSAISAADVKKQEAWDKATVATWVPPPEPPPPEPAPEPAPLPL